MVTSIVQPSLFGHPSRALERRASTALGQLPLIPLFGLLALCLIWGLSIPLTKIGLQFFPPLMLAACRYAAAAPFFALALIGRALPSRRALLAMAALGVIGIDLGQVAQIFGVQRTDAAIATVISATIPVFVVLLASWRLRQPLRIAHVIGLGVAVVGIVVVATRGLSTALELPISSLTGDLLVLLSAASIALYNTLSVELTQRYPVSTQGNRIRI